MKNDARWKRCCHGASTEKDLREITGLGEHPLGSLTACSTKRVRRIPNFIDVNDLA